MQCCKLMLRKNRGLINKYHASKLPTIGDVTNKITRQTFDVSLQKKFQYTELSEINSLNYKVGTSWNALPFSFKSDAHYEGLSLCTLNKRIKFITLSKYIVECTKKNCFSCKK